MKKSMLILAIAIVFTMVSQAFAASVAPIVTATGNVNTKCTWISDGTITFDIDPSGTGVITANTTANGTDPKVKCTKDTTYGVACTSAHSLKLTIGNDGTTDPIDYTITGCATPITGTGFGSGKEVNIPVGVSIAQSAYENAQVGAHVDTITVTVTY